jgi:pimeloyl-ACP methyl ester carboxylesterase
VDAPVSLIVGQLDRTAFRATSAPPAMRERIRTVPQAAEEAVGRFPQARLVRLPGLGHAPQIEDPDAFMRALLGEIER